VTDRTTGSRQTVVLRAERVDSGEVSFNSGARVETIAGDVVRMNAALLGELDFVTPKGGWLPDGKVRAGTWSIRGDSIVPGSGRQYDLVASTDEEQMVDTPAGSLPARRIALRGWLRHTGTGHVPATARYEGAVWVSPKLGRVVRFEAKSRASGGTGTSYFFIDESAELVRVGAD
jgi:serine protease Do